MVFLWLIACNRADSGIRRDYVFFVYVSAVAESITLRLKSGEEDTLHIAAVVRKIDTDSFFRSYKIGGNANGNGKKSKFVSDVVQISDKRNATVIGVNFSFGV